MQVGQSAACPTISSNGENMKANIDQRNLQLYDENTRKAYKYSSTGLVFLAILICMNYSDSLFFAIGAGFLIYLPYAVWFYLIGIGKNENPGVIPLAVMLVAPVLLLFMTTIWSGWRPAYFIGFCSLLLIVHSIFQIKRKKSEVPIIHSIIPIVFTPVLFSCSLIAVLQKGESSTLCVLFFIIALCLVSFIIGNILLIRQLRRNRKALRNSVIQPQ